MEEADLKQCPYSISAKCTLEYDCLSCEVYGEYILGHTTPLWAIEKETMVKPKYDDNIRCGKCILLIETQWNYCPGCGVKINWENEE